MAQPSGSSPVRKKTSSRPSPPGNTGTHWTGPNAYLYAQLTRANFITARRTPFAETSDDLCTALQRLVHFEGNRPPNRKILLHLRLLTYYSPNNAILPELITLLESENVHICRLAHYHVRQNAPILDLQIYRELVEALEREVIRPSPARRAAATKTLAKIFHSEDTPRAAEFVIDVFNCIGGARVKDVHTPAPRKIAGVEIPGTDKNKKKDKKAESRATGGLISRRVVAGESYDASKDKKEKEEKRKKPAFDDGAGGSLQSATGNAEFVRSKFGKMLVGHTVFAAMRRINRVATKSARVESNFFDSGFLSVVPSTVRHCVALLEWRSTAAPGPVSKYLVQRLPHKNPPATKRLHLEDLGARVYYARLLSVLAEDPNLSAYIPDEAPKQAKRENAEKNTTIKEALSGTTYRAKATGLFKFLFNSERVNQVMDTVKTTAAQSMAATRAPRLKRNDPLGVDFAEALINLLKNASNRVLIEALRGLSRRRWTTWFEAPIPQGALYNSPELQDGEAYGGTADAWGLDEEEDEEEEEDDSENELGAYENDLAGYDQDGSKGSLRSGGEVTDPALDDLNPSGEKETWFSRLNLQRKERRQARVENQTPFYLRRVGQGMVPALEVILRRVNAALLHDEPVRRFAAADAIIVLARAKLYGHTQSDHDELRKARSSAAQTLNHRGALSRALVVTDSASTSPVASALPDSTGEKHPFQPLVRPLAELIEEDPNQFVRGRAAVALLFVITAGAGREVVEPDDMDIAVTDEAIARSAKLQNIPLLLRYFRTLVTHESAGSGIGLRLVSEIIDYLVYEVLDVAPELAPSAVDMAELWAMTHPTVGVCGRLGALWEKVLSIGQGEVVGKSIFRAVACSPSAERVGSAAVIFLRRRTLDLAIITVGSSQVRGVALPEPLPRAVGVEMEKYFSLLWHAALLGPSAECRTFAVEALGGAAALAGEPFRCCTYERLVELVRMRGFGLKIVAEQVLNCLDMLYFSRERFSEARARNRIARDGGNKSKEWLELVWKLAAESSSAAQILLGVAPPTGWQALGPSGAADVCNAEEGFGDVRDRQDSSKMKQESVTLVSAPTEVPLLCIESGEAGWRGNSGAGASNIGKIGSGRVEVVPSEAGGEGYLVNRGRSRSESRSRSRSRERNRRDENSGEWPRRYGEDVEYVSGTFESGRDFEYRRGRSRSDSRGEYRIRRSRSYNSEEFYDDGRNGGEVSGNEGSRRATEADMKRRQEEKDLELAVRLQSEEAKKGGGGNESGGGMFEERRGGRGGLDTAKDLVGNASEVAGKWLGKGLKSGKELTGRAIKAAGSRAAVERVRGSK